MNRPLLITLIVGTIGCPAFAQFAPISNRSTRVRRAHRVLPIRALLQKRVDKVTFDDTAFSDVIDWLRSQKTPQGKVNIVPRWRALLANQSIDEDSVVSLTMEDTTVKAVLDEVLDQLSDLDPLTYMGTGKTLKISTKSDFDRKLYTRLYDIADILLEIQDYTGSPQIDLQQQQQSSGGGGGGQGGRANVQSIFSNSGGGGDDDDEEDDDDERFDEIMDWIKAVVEPDSWIDNGGLGSMAVFNDQLAVRATLTVHEILGGPFDFDR